MSEIFVNERGDVRCYTLIPSFVFKLLSDQKLKGMYDKAMNQARGDYSDPMVVAIDFDDIARATVMLEKEMVRRGFEKKPLSQSKPEVYASDVWKSYC